MRNGERKQTEMENKVSSESCAAREGSRTQNKGSVKGKKKDRRRARNKAVLDNGNGERHNDPNWYFLDANIADKAASFSFDQFIGTDVQFPVATIGTGKSLTWGTAASYVPSILSMEINPSPGDTEKPTAGINMAALKIYTQLSARNAKTTIYAPQDITMLILAMGEIISVVEHIRRAFGVAYTYNQRNRALPRRLLQVMGFDPDEFLKGLADKQLEFNSWVTGINKIPFPANIAYIYKCATMYQNVYLDSESAMAQVVLMRPRCTWTLEETLSDTGSVLKTSELPLYTSDTALANSWDEWSLRISTMIEALASSSTYNSIYSDILMLHDKYSMPLMQVSYLEPQYAVVPQYNRNFMLQVHNATPCNQPVKGVATIDASHTDWNDVVQDVGRNKIKYKPLFPVQDNTTMLTTPIIDMDVPTADVVDRIEATRYMTAPTFFELKDNIYAEYALPDHYVVNFRVILGDGAAGAGITEGVKGHTFNLVQASVNPDNYPNIYALSQIDWAPLTYVIQKDDEEKNYLTLLGDLNYWTTLPLDWFKRVNDLTFQALFELR